MADWLAGRMAALKELHSTKSHYLLESAMFKRLSGQTLSQYVIPFLYFLPFYLEVTYFFSLTEF